MCTDYDRVRAYYESFDEWARLDTAEGRLEFDRAIDVLERYLQPSSRVLDLGGGPGRYTIALAERGHRVVLVDVSKSLVEQARQRIRAAGAGVRRSVEASYVANATSLEGFEDASFHAVIAFGPFYHLTTESEREAAGREIVRVLSPRGLLFAAFVPRLCGVAGLIVRGAQQPQQVVPDSLKAALETGVFHNASQTGFQEGFYFEPAEIEEFFEARGLSKRALVSLRGLAWCGEKAYWELSTALRDAARELIEETESHPAVVSCCGHALYVGRKR